LTNFLASSDGLKLAKAFMQVPSPALRRRIIDLIEEMGTAEAEHLPSKH
jgi:hypothetical protein